MNQQFDLDLAMVLIREYVSGRSVIYGEEYFKMKVSVALRLRNYLRAGRTLWKTISVETLMREVIVRLKGERSTNFQTTMVFLGEGIPRHRGDCNKIPVYE